MDLTILNTFTQLSFLSTFFDTSHDIDNAWDGDFLLGDIKLQQLRHFIMESQSGPMHRRGSLVAPHVTLQHIPTSCQVSIQSVLVQVSVLHAQCKGVWGRDQIRGVDYHQLIPLKPMRCSNYRTFAWA